MNNIRVLSESYYEKNNNLYKGLCNDSSITSLVLNIQAIQKQNFNLQENSFKCNDSDTEWVVSAYVEKIKPEIILFGLFQTKKETRQPYFACTDSTGNRTTLSKQLAEGQMKCE